MKIYLIDIDGTCSEDIKNEDSHLYESAKVIPGSVEKINELYEMGNVITFFTAREEKDREVTENWLRTNGFKFNGLIMDKPRCTTDDSEYIWIDNRKVTGVLFDENVGWGKTI